MSSGTLVVAGFTQLADALETTGTFERVVRVASTSELKAAIGTTLNGVTKSEAVFLFADNTTVDTPQTLDFLVSKLVGGGWRVIILEASARGRAIVEATPKARFMPAPHTLNKTLAGLAGIGVPGIEPVDWGHQELSSDRDAAPAAGTGGWESADAGWESAAPAAPAPEPQPAPQPDPQPQPQAQAQAAPANDGWADAGGGWSSSEAPAAAPTSQPGGAGGWESPQNPPANTPGDAWGGSGDTWGAGPTDDGWGAPRQTGGGLAARGPQPGGLAARGQGGEVGAGPATPEPLGYVISIVAPKGGVGKSTVALNLGTYFGQRLQGTGRRVCVVDANFQQADSGKYLGTYRPNIVDLAKLDGALTPQAVGQNLVQRTDLNISVLLGPATPSEASPHYINGTLYRSAIQTLRRMFDYIIVDTPVAELYHDIFDQFVLPESDYLVVCVTPNSPTLINTHLWLRSITSPSHAGGRDFDERKIGILLNRAEDDVGFDEADVQEELASFPFLGSIPETKEWKRANNHGQIVAMLNYTELNAAFARVLYAATSDPALADALTSPDLQREGLMGRLFRKKKRSA